MTTILKRKKKLGPEDHGRELTYEEFLVARSEEGYQYELINGRLYVTPLPNPPQNVVEKWLEYKIADYSRNHRDIINYVTNKARVFVPGMRKVTNPEPDIAAYHDFPLHLRFEKIRWEDVNPILAAAILSIHDPKKDLVRNVHLYLRVLSIQEYWIVDTRQDPERPTMKVHRRRGRKWQVINVAASEVYSTKLLPGFELTLDPRT